MSYHRKSGGVARWPRNEYRTVGICPTASTLWARARDPTVSSHRGGDLGSAGYRPTELEAPPGSGAVTNGPIGTSAGAGRSKGLDPGCRGARSGLVVDAVRTRDQAHRLDYAIRVTSSTWPPGGGGCVVVAAVMMSGGCGQGAADSTSREPRVRGPIKQSNVRATAHRRVKHDDAGAGSTGLPTP